MNWIAGDTPGSIYLDPIWTPPPPLRWCFNKGQNFSYISVVLGNFPYFGSLFSLCVLQNKGIEWFWSKYINNIYEHGLWRKETLGTMTTISNSYRMISWQENRVYTISKGHVGRERRNTQQGNFGQYKQKVKKNTRKPQLFRKDGNCF